MVIQAYFLDSPPTFAYVYLSLVATVEFWWGYIEENGECFNIKVYIHVFIFLIFFKFFFSKLEIKMSKSVNIWLFKSIFVLKINHSQKL